MAPNVDLEVFGLKGREGKGGVEKFFLFKSGASEIRGFFDVNTWGFCEENPTRESVQRGYEKSKKKGRQILIQKFHSNGAPMVDLEVFGLKDSV